MFDVDFITFKEFEKSGDPDKYYQELVSLAKEGVAKGKVGNFSLNDFLLQVNDCPGAYADRFLQQRLLFIPCDSSTAIEFHDLKHDWKI